MKTRILYQRFRRGQRGHRQWTCANPNGLGVTTNLRSTKAAIAHALAEMGGADQPHTIRRRPGGVIEVRVSTGLEKGNRPGGG